MTVYTVETLVSTYRDKVNASGLPDEMKELFAASLHCVSDYLSCGQFQAALMCFGGVQQRICDAGLYTYEEIREHAKTHDTAFPPPVGMDVVPVKIEILFLCGNCRGTITRLARDLWLPRGVQPDELTFPSDPGRTERLCNVGVHMGYFVQKSTWDYADNTMILTLHPMVLNPEMDEENMALMLSILREEGWGFPDEVSKNWNERWENHRKVGKAKPSPDCVPHGFTPLGGILGDVFGGVGEVTESKPKKKKKKPKKDDKDTSTD